MKKVALITGGAKRIGKAICLSLASQGYSIALQYNHSNKEAECTAKTIRKKGGICELFCAELTDNEQINKIVPSVIKKFSHIDILINNASTFTPSSLRKDLAKNLVSDFSINFNAPAVLISEFVKHTKKGEVINLLDSQVVKNRSKHTVYLLAKKSLQELTKLAAAELAPHFRVNSVAPGCILLPEGKGKAYELQRIKNIPLKRKGNVTHITQTISFLIENDYITGQTIFVDGGDHL